MTIKVSIEECIETLKKSIHFREQLLRTLKQEHVGDNKELIPNMYREIGELYCNMKHYERELL